MKNVLLILILICSAGCELYEQEGHNELIVIEGYAVANQTLPDIFVSTTIPLDTEYMFHNAALRGANVQVALLDEENDDEEVFNYKATESSPVIYQPQDRTHHVLHGRTYRLDIYFNNRPEIIQAYTTVPDSISIVNEVADTVIYQSDDQLELVISADPNHQKKHVFVMNSIALMPEPENLTPFYTKFVEERDSEAKDFRKTWSGLINETSFETNMDGTITILLPWFTVAFYKDNVVVANSADRNLADFIRSQNVQLGGSTLPPGEIPNARYNMKGGIGVFGSISSDTVYTYFKRPDS